MESSPKNKTKIPSHQFVLVGVLAILAVGFLDNQMQRRSTKQPVTETRVEKDAVDFKFWVWVSIDKNKADSSYTKEFKKYREYGFDAILIDATSASNDLEHLTVMAEKEGLMLYAWAAGMDQSKDLMYVKGQKVEPTLVNESQGQWHMDILFPMNLSYSDSGDFNCAGQIVQQGKEKIKEQDSKQYVGKHLIQLPPKDFKDAIVKGQANGARAVSVHEASLMSSEHWDVIKELNNKFNL